MARWRRGGWGGSFVCLGYFWVATARFGGQRCVPGDLASRGSNSGTSHNRRCASNSNGAVSTDVSLAGATLRPLCTAMLILCRYENAKPL